MRRTLLFLVLVIGCGPDRSQPLPARSTPPDASPAGLTLVASIGPTQDTPGHSIHIMLRNTNEYPLSVQTGSGSGISITSDFLYALRPLKGPPVHLLCHCVPAGIAGRYMPYLIILPSRSSSPEFQLPLSLFSVDIATPGAPYGPSHVFDPVEFPGATVTVSLSNSGDTSSEQSAGQRAHPWAGTASVSFILPLPSPALLVLPPQRAPLRGTDVPV